MTVWGSIISVGAVRRAAEATLKLWLPASLVEVARQDGRDPRDPQQLEPQLVREWKRVQDSRAAPPPAQTPAVSTSSGGLINETEDDGDGSLYGTWGLVVLVQLHGSSYEDTVDRVGIYCAGIRAALTQHADLGGFAESTVFLGEDYAFAPPETSRTYGSGFVEFAVRPAAPLLDIYAGPDEPPADPFGEFDDRPDVDDVVVTETHLT